jgi:hypothetical protein
VEAAKEEEEGVDEREDAGVAVAVLVVPVAAPSLLGLSSGGSIRVASSATRIYLHFPFALRRQEAASLATAKTACWNTKRTVLIE